MHSRSQLYPVGFSRSLMCCSEVVLQLRRAIVSFLAEITVIVFWHCVGGSKFAWQRVSGLANSRAAEQNGLGLIDYAGGASNWHCHPSVCALQLHYSRTNTRHVYSIRHTCSGVSSKLSSLINIQLRLSLFLCPVRPGHRGFRPAPCLFLRVGPCHHGPQ